MAQVQSLQRSRAVEQLEGFARPCGLAKLLLLMPIFQESLFISFKKRLTLLLRPIAPSIQSVSSSSCRSAFPSLIVLRITPAIQAMRQAASLPLGSIMPKQRSCREQSAPILSQAVVPIMAQLFLVALTFTRFASAPARPTNYRMVMRFIILVRLAISRFLQFRLPQRARPSRISYTIQLLADTSGMSVRYSRVCDWSVLRLARDWEQRLRTDARDLCYEPSLLREGVSIGCFSRERESDILFQWLLQEALWAMATTVGRSLSLIVVFLEARGGKRMAVAETCILFQFLSTDTQKCELAITLNQHSVEIRPTILQRAARQRRKRSQKLVVLFCLLLPLLPRLVKRQQLDFSLLLSPLLLARPSLFLGVDLPAGKGSLVSESRELVVKQSGRPRNLHALGSYIFEFIALRPLPLHGQLQPALRKRLGRCVLPQHFEKRIHYEERVVSSEEGGIGDGTRLFVAVIKMRSIDEFWQSFEGVALCVQSVFQGQHQIRRPLVLWFWLQGLRGSEGFDVDVSQLQLEFLEGEIAVPSAIFALEVVRLSEVALELARRLALHRQYQLQSTATTTHLPSPRSLIVYPLQFYLSFATPGVEAGVPQYS